MSEMLGVGYDRKIQGLLCSSAELLGLMDSPIFVYTSTPVTELLCSYCLMRYIIWSFECDDYCPFCGAEKKTSYHLAGMMGEIFVWEGK